MLFTPFPDTPRLPITATYEDSFVQIVKRANLNPDDYRLHYARYFVTAGRRGTQITPRVLLAHAYTLKTAVNIKQELRISYTSTLA